MVSHEDIEAHMAAMRAQCARAHGNTRCHVRGDYVWQCEYHDGVDDALHATVCETCEDWSTGAAPATTNG